MIGLEDQEERETSSGEKLLLNAFSSDKHFFFLYTLNLLVHNSQITKQSISAQRQ